MCQHYDESAKLGMNQQHKGADNVGGNFGSLFKCSLNTPFQIRDCLNLSIIYEINIIFFSLYYYFKRT